MWTIFQKVKEGTHVFCLHLSNAGSKEFRNCFPIDRRVSQKDLSPNDLDVSYSFILFQYVLLGR